jgi:hypothetical protein
MTVDPGVNTPFVIEWTPNIMPIMKMGELKLTFKFGHQRNGKIELRTKDILQSSGCEARL